MKRITALILTLIMLCSSALVVAAEAGNQSQTAELIHIEGGEVGANVAYGVKQKYTVNVPPEIMLSEENESYLTVSFTEVYIPRSKTLKLTVSSINYKTADGYWHVVLTEDANATVQYQIKNGQTAIAGGGEVLSYSGDEGSEVATLTMSVAQKPSKSGSYVDRLTFTASIQ